MSFYSERTSQKALTFDDVLLVPAYSEVLPREVRLEARFTRHITLKLPLVSAAMDTVTGQEMALAMALIGGIGVIHKNMSIEQQAAAVSAVKTFVVPEDKAAQANTDDCGRLRVAAGVGVAANSLERVEALVRSGVDAIVLDSAHGHSKGVVDLLRTIKEKYPALDVVVGNVATGDAVRMLVENGADGVKVGIGPGSICTTRIVAGVGVPQLSAIFDCHSALEGGDVPLIADGGLRYSGDIVKALAAGGDCVMCGSMFAGTDEAPGEVVEIDGVKFKTYRGMGSLDAMRAGSADRYFHDKVAAGKLVPEGVVGRVPYKGSVSDVIFQIVGGLRSGMGYCGAPDIPALWQASFVRITGASVAENHPHDIIIAEKSPNYPGR